MRRNEELIVQDTIRSATLQTIVEGWRAGAGACFSVIPQPGFAVRLPGFTRANSKRR